MPVSSCWDGHWAGFEQHPGRLSQARLWFIPGVGDVSWTRSATFSSRVVAATGAAMPYSRDVVRG
eukprot:2997566-Prymnesium_polylepis.3